MSATCELIVSIKTCDVTPFEPADVCQVLFLYIDNNASVPWEDLRYIFGEIMYGGHITDPWDRVQSSSYLGLYITDALFNGFELAPGHVVAYPTAQGVEVGDQRRG